MTAKLLVNAIAAVATIGAAAAGATPVAMASTDQVRPQMPVTWGPYAKTTPQKPRSGPGYGGSTSVDYPDDEDSRGTEATPARGSQNAPDENGTNGVNAGLIAVAAFGVAGAVKLFEKYCGAVHINRPIA